MPVYSYICLKCSAKFDLLVGMTQEKTDLKCPDCGSKKIQKQFSTFKVSGTSSKCDSCSGGDCSTCS